MFAQRFSPFLYLCLVLLSCSQAPTEPATAAAPGLVAEQAQAESTQAAADKPYPRTPAEATALKEAGHEWTNCEIRIYYNKLVGEIAGADAARQREEASAEARARAAFDTRHNARITARAMMANEVEVNLLRARDQKKYGNPDGPTFEMLVEAKRAKGLEGEDVYTAIVAGSQRTDAQVNQACGIQSR